MECEFYKGMGGNVRIPADLSCGPIITSDVTAKVIGLCHLFVMKIRLR